LPHQSNAFRPGEKFLSFETVYDFNHTDHGFQQAARAEETPSSFKRWEKPWKAQRVSSGIRCVEAGGEVGLLDE